jgi:hypothetical protein
MNMKTVNGFLVSFMWQEANEVTLFNDGLHEFSYLVEMNWKKLETSKLICLLLIYLDFS